MELKDAENDPNIITSYPSWTMAVTTLKSVTLASDPTFDWFLKGADKPVTVAFAIQELGGISIQFNMGDIPVDKNGCYILFEFPNDIRLDSKLANIFQGEGIFLSKTQDGSKLETVA